MKSGWFTLFSVAVVSLLVLTACGGGSTSTSGGAPTAKPAAAKTGDAKVGEAKFQGTCASCHGPDAKGLPGLGKDLTVSEFFKGLSDADAVAFVMKGRPSTDPANTAGVDMPPKGGNPALSEQDLYDIIAYMRTLQK
ncbi:MAG TPA: cytochrome c [Anaerolineae bacterium]